MIKRIFISRKTGFDIERTNLIDNIKENFNLNLESLNYYIIYDIFNINEDIYKVALNEIFSEVNKDFVTENPSLLRNVIAHEFLPGQFDQRADSAVQCIKLLNPKSTVNIKSGLLITFDEVISPNDINRIKSYLINEVESREKNLDVLLLEDTSTASENIVIDGFIKMELHQLEELHQHFSFAMSMEDLLFIQQYFVNEENRNPLLTELKVLDTYWSDHCRHTTFETEIIDVAFSNDSVSTEISKTYQQYLNDRTFLKRDNKPITLMDIATINAKLERENGNLEDLEISEEINAASIHIDVDVNGQDKQYLLMFKNETHNHPTEIEPYGGASTCIGGAIRDPLSGRSFVYGAMRITGAGDITEPIHKTLKGKLPQRVISKVAAQGYSSYGNQIGLATTYVKELYHEGYKAKRMEIGAVIGAAPLENVRRETPVPGDIIILLGGRTGRDGIGGATGSSKTHNSKSLDTSSSEVQKGNAPEERKIQRLFRNKNVTELIKKSNDFGAGGVSVAIGELADGIKIDLNNVPTKYDGITGLELAISESQERMSVVIDPKDYDTFIRLCETENIEATKIAEVTKEKRLVMTWNDTVICNISRDFINTSGVRQKTSVSVSPSTNKNPFNRFYEGDTLQEKIETGLQDLNISSQQGLCEMFDSTVGRTTVLAPYGGLYQLTPTQTSIQKIPVLHGQTNTVSMMSYGFNPYISEWSPYHGSQYAVIESMAKIVASGGRYQTIRFTFQEYFERLGNNPEKWGKPFSALLGAYQALQQFHLPAIGGKDSMSGTYHEITVPPTLVSFAVNTANINDIISPEFKKVGSYLYLVPHTPNPNMLPNYEQLKNNFEFLNNNITSQNILSATALEFGGLFEALLKSSFGNKIGIEVSTSFPLFDFSYGSILIESNVELEYEHLISLGRTNAKEIIKINDAELTITECIEKNQKTIRDIFPIVHQEHRQLKQQPSKKATQIYHHKQVDEVRVLLPVFPGTNCEYDSMKAFDEIGAVTKIFVFNNQTEKHIEESITTFAKLIKESHIILFSGGFSSGDEPDGSGKFIASVLRNTTIKNAIDEHLKQQRLILGICNGFQALVKAGLLPYGEIKATKTSDPLLFKNKINRHISKFANTKVSSVKSPWLTSFKVDDTHTIAFSHGEGQFIIDEAGYQDLLEHDQIAFQYVDDSNQPTYLPHLNPNGSSYAIEGIVSKDGLILGKMGHSERYEDGLFKNIYGNKKQDIFSNAIHYFKGE